MCRRSKLCTNVELKDAEIIELEIAREIKLSLFTGRNW